MADKNKKSKYPPFQEATMFNDVFFRLLLENNIIVVQKILQIILGKPDLIVIESVVQKNENMVGHKNVIFDVKAKDSSGRFYDIEIQNKADSELKIGL